MRKRHETWGEAKMRMCNKMGVEIEERVGDDADAVQGLGGSGENLD